MNYYTHTLVRSGARLLRGYSSRYRRPAGPRTNAAATMKLPEVNTWWERTCNLKRYFLRQIHDSYGKTYVWIYEDGVNRCYHLPLTTLLKRYRQLHVGPVDPATGRSLAHLN